MDAIAKISQKVNPELPRSSGLGYCKDLLFDFFKNFFFLFLTFFFFFFFTGFIFLTGSGAFYINPLLTEFDCPEGKDTKINKKISMKLSPVI